MKLIYVGTMSAVDVPGLGSFTRGEPREVENERAARKMMEQNPGDWDVQDPAPIEKYSKKRTRRY